MVGTVFDHIGSSPDNLEFRIKVSVIEIYMEKVRDLLNPTKHDLKIREDKTKGVYIQDVTENYVSEEQEIYDVLKVCSGNR
jgi:kinesin family protein 5